MEQGQSVRTNSSQTRHATTAPTTTSRLSPQIPIQTVQLITRPSSITICSIVMFASAVITLLLVLTQSPMVTQLHQALHPAAIYISITYTFVCGIGYWTMKRWAGLLYALEVAVRLWAGLPTGYVALPSVIVAFGIINFDEMTWK